MRPSALFALLPLVLAAGCEPETTYSGYDMWDYFPTDGERTWEFANEAADYDYQVSMSSAFETVGTAEVHTFEFFDKANGDLLMTQRWSSDSINGILLHGYEILGEGGGGDDTGDDTGDTGANGPVESMTFSPPVVFAERKMIPGTAVVTETGGYTFTSTVEAQTECPNHWISGDATWNCLRVVLDDGDGDPNAGVGVAGTYWIVQRWVFSWFQLTGDAEPWVLVTASAERPD